jgi:hypothetical protein
MQFSEAQLDGLKGTSEAAFLASLQPHALAYFPTVHETCGPDGIAQCGEIAVKQAAAHGFTGRACVRTWFDMQMLLGAEFASDPLLAFLHPLLDWDAARQALAQRDPEWPVGIVTDSDEPDPVDMLDAVHALAWEWIDRTAGDNYRNLYKALVRLRTVLGREQLYLPDEPEGLIAAFGFLFPEKTAVVSDRALDAFLAQAARRAAEDGFAAGDGRSLYILQAFIGGIGAYRDPAFTIDGRLPATVIAPGDAAAHRAFVTAYIVRLVDAARRLGAVED